MLFDPLEEQFHLPSALVECADARGRQGHLIREEDERLAGLGILETDAAQVVGVVLLGVVAIQRDDLVADQAGTAIRLGRIDPMEVHIRLGACNEEGAGFQWQQVECMHVVQLAVGNMDEAWNAAAQVEQRVHLHGGLGRAEVRPGKQRQAQVDGRRIQCIHRIRQFQPQVLAGVESSRLDDQTLREVGPDAPIARFVGIGQGRAPHRFAKPHVVELGGLGRQTGFDVAQALPVSQLGKGHNPELLRATQRAHSFVALVASHVPGEGRPRQKVHQLGEQHLACVHGELRGKAGETARIGPRHSNRHHPIPPGNPRQSWLAAFLPFI